MKKEPIKLRGRPAHYNSPEELQKAVEEYFNNCPDTRMVKHTEFVEGRREERMIEVPHYTKSGLSLALGFFDRASMYDYEKRPEYSHIIKEATKVVENGYEKLTAEDGKATGAIFVLKNMGWKDRTDITSDDKQLESKIAIVNSRVDAEEWGK